MSTIGDVNTLDVADFFRYCSRRFMDKKTIYFSSFAESGRLANTIAISRSVPRWYKGARIIDAAPTMAMVQRFKRNNDGQWQWFLQAYMQQIYDLLKLEEWYEQAKGKILLCHCPKTDLCHRILLAKTFEIEFGAVVEEIGGWSIPFNKPFEKIDKFAQQIVVDKKGVEHEVVGNYLKIKGLIAAGEL
jgi:hypothetical protein